MMLRAFFLGVTQLQLAAAPDTALVWEKLTYKLTAGGFDAHENEALSAECAITSEGVQLRGIVQCKLNIRSCFDKPLTQFATLPPGCRPGGTVTSSPVTVDSGGDLSDKPVRTTITADSEGVLTVAAAAPQQWTMKLDSVVLPLASSWYVPLPPRIASSGLPCHLCCLNLNPRCSRALCQGCDVSAGAGNWWHALRWRGHRLCNQGGGPNRCK
jgi:hypothetical protein